MDAAESTAGGIVEVSEDGVVHGHMMLMSSEEGKKNAPQKAGRASAGLM